MAWMLPCNRSFTIRSPTLAPMRAGATRIAVATARMAAKGHLSLQPATRNGRKPAVCLGVAGMAVVTLLRTRMRDGA